MEAMADLVTPSGNSLNCKHVCSSLDGITSSKNTMAATPSGPKKNHNLQPSGFYRK